MLTRGLILNSDSNVPVPARYNTLRRTLYAGRFISRNDTGMRPHSLAYLLPTGNSILRRKEKQQKERRKKRLLFVARTITHPPGRTVKSYSLDSVALSPRFGKK